MNISFESKAALVTGAGDRVVATGRNLEKVRNDYPDVAQENIAFVQLDVANEAQAKAAVDQATKRFGRIDVLVNNCSTRKTSDGSASRSRTTRPRAQRTTCGRNITVRSRATQRSWVTRSSKLPQW